MTAMTQAPPRGVLPGGLSPVIVGYGHAGCNLHHRSLRSVAGGDPAVIAVDPMSPTRPGPGLQWVPTLAAALTTVDITRSVFHVATPVHAHRTTVDALASAGARYIILEKPIAPSVADAQDIAAIAASGVQIVPMSVWLSSAVTARIEADIAIGRIGSLSALHLEQSKPRFRRSSQRDAHQSALEVELPHQLLLALHLAGPVAAMTDVKLWPMILPDGAELPGMGGVTLTLTHTNGVISTLVSDLTAPVRIRRLRMSGNAGEVIAHFPVSGADDVGQLHLPGQPGRVLVQDAPLTRFIGEAYRYFAGLMDRPPSGDLLMHLRVAELMAAAAQSAERPSHREITQSSW